MQDALTQQQAKDIARLRLKKYREEEGRMVLEGERLVADILRGGPLPDLVILADSRFERADELLRLSTQRGVPVLRASARLMAKISDTRHPQGVAAVLALPSTRPQEALDIAAMDRPLFALHGIADPGNLGTMIRTTEWFGGSALLLSADSVDPFNPKVVRGSMGSSLRLRIGVYPDFDWLEGEARRAGRQLVATVAEGGDPPDVYAGNVGLLPVLGNEAHGLSADIRSRIPSTITIHGSTAESLNVAIAHAVLQYALRTVRGERNRHPH
ncbi:MAG: RNA methyltransferase [Bacteroidetes bacterium]|nr:RNA methyltransferase [Bacteroidota bacterium]